MINLENNIIKAEIKDLEYIADMHLKYIPVSFYSYLGKDFIKIIYKNLILSDNAGTYVFYQNQKCVGYISFLLNRKKFFFEVLKKNCINIILIIKLKDIILIIKYFINTVKYVFNKNIKNSELLFIAVEKENRQKKIASNLIDVAQKIIINNEIKDVQVCINDDNRVCQKIIENKGYVFMQTIVLYNKKMKLYVKSL